MAQWYGISTPSRVAGVQIPAEALLTHGEFFGPKAHRTSFKSHKASRKAAMSENSTSGWARTSDTTLNAGLL